MNTFRKNIIFYLLISSLSLITVSQFLIGCGSNNSNNNQQAAPPPTPVQAPYGSGYYYNQQNPYGYGGLATSPLGTGCISGDINCQMSMYNSYGMYGYSSYPINPYNWGGYNNYYNQFGGGYGNGGYMNFCSCPMGTRPVYNSYAGLGCVQINQFQPYFSAAMYFSLQPNNYQWVNIPQIPNTVGYGNSNYGGQNCFSNVAQACFVDQTGSCGPGAFCRVTAAASRIGICVSNGSNGANGLYR